MKMKAETKMGVGAVLACFGAIAVVLGPILGWSGAPQPWSFLLGFLFGILLGLGAALSVAGLIEYRRGR